MKLFVRIMGPFHVIRLEELNPQTFFRYLLSRYDYYDLNMNPCISS
jgi:hypothetical protein